MQEIFERLSALCWLLAIFASAAMDSEAWIPVLAVLVLSSIGAYGFYRAAEWAYDYENSRNKSKERKTEWTQTIDYIPESLTER